jgi:hypothetical protein
VALVTFIAQPEWLPFHPSVIALMADNWRYLAGSWDLVLLWTIFLWSLVRSVVNRPPASKSGKFPRIDFLEIMPLSFLSLFLALPVVGIMNHLLTRYYVAILPFLIISIAVGAHAISGKLSIGFLIALMVFSIANREGGLLPGNDSFDPPIIERSDAYRYLLQVQREALTRVETMVSTSTPVIFGLPQHYMTRYPFMGYVEEPLMNGRSTWLDPQLATGSLACFPRHFVMVVDYHSLGGNQLYKVWMEANSNRKARVNVETIRAGTYEGYVVEIWQDSLSNSTCPRER